MAAATRQAGRLVLPLSYVVLALIALAVAVLFLITLRPGHDWGDDFAMYICHAKNILEGTPYADTGYIYNPFYPSLGPRTYPPVFPLLLLPSYALFGLNVTPMKVEMVLSIVLSLPVLFLAFRGRLPDPWLLAVVAVVGFNPCFFDFKETLKPELPFLFISYLCLFLIQRAYDAQRGRPPHTRQALLIGAMLYLCYGTRSLGLVLVPALLVYDIIRLRQPSRFALVATLLFAVLAILQSVFVHSSESYLDQLAVSRGWLGTVLHNAPLYITSLSYYWANGHNVALGRGLLALVSALMVVGLALQLWREVTVYELFFMFYVAAILLWPSSQDRRFLIAVFPLFVLYVFQGLQALIPQRWPLMDRLPMAALVTCIAATYVGAYTVKNYGPIRDGVSAPTSVELFRYLRESTDPNAVLIFRRPRALALYTGRSASVYHRTEHDSELWEYFRQIGATHIVVGRVFDSDRAYLQPFVQRNEGALELVYSNTDFWVYRIVGDRIGSDPAPPVSAVPAQFP